MDPITLLAAASTAFNGVKKLIEHGREIEDVFSQLGNGPLLRLTYKNGANNRMPNPVSLRN